MFFLPWLELATTRASDYQDCGIATSERFYQASGHSWGWGEERRYSLGHQLW